MTGHGMNDWQKWSIEDRENVLQKQTSVCGLEFVVSSEL